MISTDGEGCVTITGLRSAKNKRKKSVGKTVSQYKRSLFDKELQRKSEPRWISRILDNSMFFNRGILKKITKDLHGGVKIDYDLDNKMLLYEEFGENTKMVPNETGEYQLGKGKPNIRGLKLEFLKELLFNNGDRTISYKMAEEKIKAALTVKRGVPILVASNVAEYRKGCSLLKTLINQIKYVPKESVNWYFLKLQQWKNLVKRAFQKYKVLVHVKGKAIYAVGMNTSAVLKEIKLFVEKYVTTAIDIDAGAPHKARFLAKHSGLRSLLPRSISITAVKKDVRITGAKTSLGRVARLVKQKTKNICEETWSLLMPGVVLSSKKWKERVKVIEHISHCGIRELEVGGSSHCSDASFLYQLPMRKGGHVLQKDVNPTARLPDPHECKYEEITVQVIEGDITTDDADAILNVCGEDFNLDKGTLSKTILYKADQQMQTECSNSNVYSTQYPLIRVTSGGKLSCKHVLHIVTPSTVDELGERIADVLNLADSMKLTSIALPTLGTGGKVFRVDDVASAMHKALCRFVESSPNYLKLIKVVVYDWSVVDGFRQYIIIPSVLSHDWTLQLRAAKTCKSSLLQTARFHICSETKMQIRKAKQFLERYLSKVWITEKIHDGIFNVFSDDEWIDIYAAAAAKSVLLEISESCITLLGLEESISNVCDVIEDVTFEFREGETMKKLCSWKWCLLGDTFYPLPSRMSRGIECKYVKNSRDSFYLNSIEGRMMINLAKMTFNLRGLSGIIRRIDNTNNSDNQQLDVGATSLTGVAIQRSSKPKHWNKMLGKPMRTVVLSKKSKEFQRVSRLFESSSSSNSSVVMIERVQNPALYAEYLTKKKNIKSHVTTKQVERELFYGASHSVAAETICEYGFSGGFTRKYIPSHKHVIYFATKSAYFPKSDTRKVCATSVMFLWQVLIGNFCVGRKKMEAAPIDPYSKDRNRLYDSVADKLPDPNTFVVFAYSSAYPSYLITYI